MRPYHELEPVVTKLSQRVEAIEKRLDELGSENAGLRNDSENDMLARLAAKEAIEEAMICKSCNAPLSEHEYRNYGIGGAWICKGVPIGSVEAAAKPAVDEPDGPWANVYSVFAGPELGNLRFPTEQAAAEAVPERATAHILGQCRVSQWKGVWPLVKEETAKPDLVGQYCEAKEEKMERPRVERWGLVSLRERKWLGSYDDYDSAKLATNQFACDCEVVFLVERRPEDGEPVATIEHRENDYARIVRLKDVSVLPHGTKLYATLEPPAPGPVKVETPTAERTDWGYMIREVNALVKRLQQKPKSEKCGYSVEPGGVLNAYREGDLTFDEAKAELKRIAEQPTAATAPQGKPPATAEQIAHVGGQPPGLGPEPSKEEWMAPQGKPTVHSIHCPAYLSPIMETHGVVPGECKCDGKPMSAPQGKPHESIEIHGKRWVSDDWAAKVLSDAFKERDEARNAMLAMAIELAEMTRQRDVEFQATCNLSAELSRWKEAGAAQEREMRDMDVALAAAKERIAELEETIEVSNRAAEGREYRLEIAVQRADKAEHSLAGFMESHAALEKRLAELREWIDRDSAHARGETWNWQGDGDDHLESLVCPVVIRPKQLAEIIERADKADAACIAMRKALEARLGFHEDCPELEGEVGKSFVDRLATAERDLEKAREALLRFSIELGKRDAEVARLRAAVEKLTKLPNWEKRFSSGWVDIDGAIIGIVEAAATPNLLDTPPP